MPDGALPPLPPADQPRWRTTLDELRRQLPVPGAAVAAAVAVLVLIVAGLALVRRPAAGERPSIPMAVPAPPEAEEPAAGSPEGRPEPEEVVVDVAGAVARPGLVRLRAGSRVADALAAAGGAAPDAALAGVNQARVVADGEQVRVPRVGEPLPPPLPQTPSTGGSSPSAPAAPVDLNAATPAELDTLPGVGPATAAAIITWRQENGGFRKVDDLLEVPGIGPARLERLRPHVRV